MSKIQEGRLLSPEEATEWLMGIMTGDVMDRVVEIIRSRPDAIAVVVHRPGSLVLAALKKLRFRIKNKAGTTVFGTTGASMAAAFAIDIATRHWALRSAAPNEMKIFLLGPGDGSLLLTAKGTPNGVEFQVEPEFIGTLGRA